MTHLIDNWQKPAHVHALQTSRVLNQTKFDIHPNHSNTNQIKQLQKKFELPHAPHFLQQVHSNQIIEYKTPAQSSFQFQADACFSRAKDVVCAIMTADCLPVLLTDTAGSFIAAVHCGWRSLHANILNQTIKRINTESEILAWFGPCIQQAQYEVGADFVDNYLQHHSTAANAFTPIIKGKSLASLYMLAEQQLTQCGVKNISSSGECTFLDTNYYSWRANQTEHRMATMIWLS